MIDKLGSRHSRLVRNVALICAFCLVAMTVACARESGAPKNDRSIAEFFAMNTLMRIEVRGKEAESAIEAGRAEIYRLERLFSRTAPQSEVSAINNAAGKTWTTVSDETYFLIRTAEEIRVRTGGAFDITVAPVMDMWGFTDGLHRIPGDREIKDVLALVGGDRIVLEEDGNRVMLKSAGMSLDLGGIAKGYAGDRVLSILHDYDIESALINLGGNISTIGRRPSGSAFRIAIMDPEDRSKYLGTLAGADNHIVTSGGYERFFEKDGEVYIHIMDPQTARPAESDLLSVTVVGGKGIECDILSTALFVMGKDRAIEYWSAHRNFGLVLADSTGALYVSEDLEKAFTPTEGKVVTFFD